MPGSKSLLAKFYLNLWLIYSMELTVLVIAHIYIVELLPYCTNVTIVCRNSILYYNFLTLEQILYPHFIFINIQ